MLSREEVLRIAKLARLELASEAEVALYQRRLGRVLEHVRELSSLTVSAESSVRHVPADADAFREDVVAPFPNPGALLQNAPHVQDDHFVLPAVLEPEAE